MKRLAKILALVLLAVVGIGVVKAVTVPSLTSRAAEEIKQIEVVGPTCGPNDPNNPVDASELPDINVRLRGFRPSQDNIKTDVVDYTGQFGFDIDENAPNVINIFPGGEYHPIIGSIEVGTWEGSDFESDPWENGVVFQTTTSDQIVVPSSGYDIGDDYEVMVLYADDKSIAIKYTREDNVISGYTIHILGIDVRPEILEAYKKSVANGRKTLPALKAGELLGNPMGEALLVEFRDTGAFLDPRSCVDIWDGDCDPHPDKQPKLKMSDAMILFDDWELNQRSASRAERQPQCDITYLSKYPKYPPLGSIQACPMEFPTIGSVVEEKVTVPGSIDSYYCGIQPKDPETNGSPPLCQNPPDIGSKPWDEQFCGGDEDYRWCSQDSCGKLSAASKTCQGDRVGTKNCGSYFAFCDAPDLGDGYWLNRLDKAHASDQGCSLLNESDKNTIARCMAYKGVGKVETVITAKKQLPSCVPTSSSNNRCTSACGTPLSINQNSIGFSVKGDCATGQCRASIKLKDSTPLFLPFAAKLANYFTGTYDSGAVAEGYISKEELEEIKKGVSEGDTDSVNAMFAKSGVAKKLLPEEVQDQLKCQFVSYVKDKVNKFADQATAENTKYIYRDQDSKIVEFKINGIPVSQIQIPPYIDESNNCATKKQGIEADMILAWRNSPSGEAWTDIPLFDNEDSQGKIEFVSGGVFTSELNPIQTSIPEIRRLYNVTRVLQKALSPVVPIGEIASANPTSYPLISDLNPEKLGLTIGPEITPGENLLVCRKNTPTLEEIYGTQKGYALEPNALAYNLGVDCDQQNTKTGESNNEVCTVGPEGQLNCFQQVAANPPPVTKTFENVKVQTRNVTPYLYDTFLQTIQKSGGFLRIFKPEYMNQQENSSLETRDAFEEKYNGYPAESNPIEYEITASTNVTLNPAKNGWKLLFDKLGGVWNAQQFVVDLLQPVKPEDSKN